MPVFFDTNPGAKEESEQQPLRIGLVNNMGDEALRTTERQFVSLLNAASDGIEVSVSFYTLPGIPRTAALEKHLHSNYTDIGKLWNAQLDGLIVTGREPLAAKLSGEPYWPAFTRLVEWSSKNAQSTIWSCLAAHAAVLCLDGIERERRPEKLFGVFDCRQTTGHSLLAHAPAAVRMPHSRWNGLSEDRLLACGYEVLTSCGGPGIDPDVDLFVKQQEKLFLFFQGHPEYATDTLLREYRRDAGRYLRGESQCYPSLPQRYFDAATASALTALEAKATSTRDHKVLSHVAEELENCVVKNTWLDSAAAIYKGWLSFLNARRSNHAQTSQFQLVPDLQPVS